MLSEYIKARISVLTHEDGGRSTPFWPKGGVYRPHLRVGAGEMLGVQFVDGPDEVAPGAKAEVVMQLLYPGVDYSSLVPGATFTVLEGPRVVATGIVVDRRNLTTTQPSGAPPWPK